MMKSRYFAVPLLASLSLVLSMALLPLHADEPRVNQAISTPLSNPA